MESRQLGWIAAVSILLGLQAVSLGTDRFYWDIEKYSDSTRYRLTATSPDNQRKPSSAFQADFTYVLTDTEANRVLWTRKQPMIDEKDSSGGVWHWPDEASPVAAFVDDDGWSVIRLADDDYLLIDNSGNVRGKINIVDAAFTEEEQKEHMLWTTAGTFWPEVFSHFLPTVGPHIFVVRTGWGRIIAFDLELGALIEATPEISQKAEAIEASLAIVRLQYGLNDPDECLNLPGLGDAIHLAAKLHLKDAIEMLRILEDSERISSSAFGGKSRTEQGTDEIDPHTYKSYSLRSGVQWALRELGEKPRRLPLFEFAYRDGRKPYFLPPVPNVAASLASRDVKTGMLAREVLELLGSPNEVTYDAWIYLVQDEGQETFELVLDMDQRSVTEITKRKPVE